MNKTKLTFRILSILLFSATAGLLAVGCSKEQEKPYQFTPEDYQEMNRVRPEVISYETYCIKGKKVIYAFRNLFYEIDDNGHPIPCDVK